MNKAEQLFFLKQERAIRNAKEDFYTYCRLTYPGVYRKDRPHLKEMCNLLQDLYEKKLLKANGEPYRGIIINLPPRHVKSFTVQNFSDWILGKNKHEKIIATSYNETLSQKFGKQVRDVILMEKADPYMTIYQDIFDTRIKIGEGAVTLWAAEGSYMTFLGTSPGGTVTGFGGSCFPAGTKIMTDKGIIPIESITLNNNIRALSLNHEKRIIEYKEIEALRVKTSADLRRIKLSDGTILEATSDHKIYVIGRGYINAEHIRKGDQFITTKKNQGNLSTMQSTKNRNRKIMHGMSPEKQKKNSSFDMRLLWETIRNIKVCRTKIRAKRLQEKLLFARMFMQSKCRKPKNQTLQSMWRTCNVTFSKLLFGQMQRRSNKKKKRIKKVAERKRMPSMWGKFLFYKFKNSILFQKLCKQSSFKSNGRNRKFSLQDRYKLFKGIYRFEACNFEKRQIRMPNVWNWGKTNETCKAWTNYKPKNSSRKRGSYGQQEKEFNNLMSKLPYDGTQIVTVESIQEVFDRKDVYDLQVAGNHNFFAEGVLVHNCLIVDDLLKNAYEAMNDRILEEHWTYYNDTLQSRKEEGAIEIIIMTRWATGDLTGKILESDAGKDFYLYTKEAYDEESDKMLCESLLSKDTYEKLKNGDMSTAIFMANYHQKPIDIEGRLYDLKPYSEIPKVIRDGKEISVLDLPNADIRSVCDTADTGADYLCNICYLVWEGEAFVLDIYYTQDPQEVTETETARRLDEYGVKKAKIESNNGGRAFARNVERILWEKFKNRRCKVEWFHQNLNKEARIKSHSSYVNNHVFYPPNFKNKHKEYSRDMEKYQSGGKNEHDDGPDATTMIAEDLETKNKVKTLNKSKLGI